MMLKENNKKLKIKRKNSIVWTGPFQNKQTVTNEQQHSNNKSYYTVDVPTFQREIFSF